MIILITGASHTGKTLLAQRMLEKYKYPYFSIDHLKMGLIRSGNTELGPEDDASLTEYLWPIVRGIIKTAIENRQNLIIEGCYIPADWRNDFDAHYLPSIRFICLAMTEKYIDSMFPGFFYESGLKNMPEESIFAELVMDLRKNRPKPASSCSDNISFGIYQGDIAKLKEAVGQVDEEWIQYFGRKNRAFCAFDGDTIASFCILEDWGSQDALLVGGPGCVGTIQAYRKRGIGLEMVRRATNILIEEGFDLSWIHYTYLWKWYEKLGYRTILKWNRRGFIPTGQPRLCSK